MNPEEKQLLRHAVLECLTVRHPTALTVEGIRRRVGPEMGAVEIAEVEAALVLLQGMEPALVEFTTDEFGAQRYYRATAAGVLHAERSGK